MMATKPRATMAVPPDPMEGYTSAAPMKPRANAAIKDIVVAMGNHMGVPARESEWKDVSVLLDEIKRLERSEFVGTNAEKMIEERDAEIVTLKASVDALSEAMAQECAKLEGELAVSNKTIADLQRAGGKSTGALEMMGPAMEAFLADYQAACQAHGMRFDLGSNPKIIPVESVKQLRKDIDDVREKLKQAAEVPATGKSS